MEEGNRCWSFFASSFQLLGLVRPQIEGRNWAVFTSPRNRDRGELVRQFHPRKPRRFSHLLKGRRPTLNITAASYVMLFDPWWNPAVENQAIDRTHARPVNKVIAYRLLIKDSIEEKIRALQKTKKPWPKTWLGERSFPEFDSGRPPILFCDLVQHGVAADPQRGLTLPLVEECDD